MRANYFFFKMRYISACLLELDGNDPAEKENWMTPKRDRIKPE